MKRLLMVLALAGLAAACGDDDDDDTSPDGGGRVDSGVRPDSGTGSIDSGTPGGGDAGPKVNAVTNVGAMCTSNSDCTGAAPECKKMTLLGTTYPGGICSYTCKRDVECGTGGLCPLGEANAAGQPVTGMQTGAVTTQDCYKGCSSASDCRTGYICATMRQVFITDPMLKLLFPGALPMNSNLDKQVCVPAPSGDAGVPDAGRTADAGGLDAGR